MSFVTPDFQAIRDSYLRDILNQRPDANVASDGDYAIRANATGSTVEGLYQHQQWIVRQILPDTADSDYLERHASRKGLTRKAATRASGSILFSGAVGSPIAIGTEAKTAGGQSYVTTASDVIGADGTVTIAAQASAAGVDGNQAASAVLILSAAPSGVLSAAAISTMTGGTDIETDASLLSRLLFVLRNPPCGGAAHDYYTWAMNVAGVTAAYVYPNRCRLGTTDVAILTAGGIADPTLVAAVQAYIDPLHPVQADFLVLAPTAVPANPAGTLQLASGYTLAGVSAVINPRLAAYYATLKPGDTAYLNRVRAIVSDTPGVVDFALASPTGNVTSLVDATHLQLVTLGTPAWS